MGLLVDYFLNISIAGTVVLLIFAIMAFKDVENFHIKEGKNKKSGFIALGGGLVK